MSKQFRPVETIPEAHCMPVKWYALIKAMEEFREGTGMGLARTWGYVNEGNYEAAKQSFGSTLSIEIEARPEHESEVRLLWKLAGLEGS